MKKNIAFCMAMLISLLLSAGSMAATSTAGVKITTVSLEQSAGAVLIQTTPKHSLDAGCTNDFWLVLSRTSAGDNFDALLSMVLTAKASNATVDVAAKGVGVDFCELDRLIIQ